MTEQTRGPAQEAAGPESGRRNWLPWVVVATLAGVLMTTYRALDHVARGAEPEWLVTAIEEGTGTWGAAFLLYLMVPFLMKRVVPLRGTLMALQLHVVSVVTFSVAHTTLNWVSRSVLFRAAGLGAYDYGQMPTRYLMEAPIDLVGYTITIVILRLVQQARAEREHEVQIARLVAQLRESELAGLQARLRPHFLFNALNTVSAVMYEDVGRADRVLQSLADLLRRMVEGGDRTTVPLSEELALTESYAAIMRARMGPALSVEMKIPDAPGSAVQGGKGRLKDWPVPPLLLQPLVENAVLHGAPSDGSRLMVRVDAQRVEGGNGTEGGMLEIRIQDNGPGVDGDSFQSEATGVGLPTTRSRLATLYGNNHELSFQPSEEGGLLVTIRIPWLEATP